MLCVVGNARNIYSFTSDVTTKQLRPWNVIAKENIFICYLFFHVELPVLLVKPFADYQKYTCIRFVKLSERPSGPHIFFTTGSGFVTFFNNFHYLEKNALPVKIER